MVTIGQHVLFVILLTYALFSGRRGGDHSTAVLVVSLLELVWYLYGIPLARRSTTATSGWWWFLGLLAGWCVLLGLTQQAAWMVIPLVFLALHVLPRRIGMATVFLATGCVAVAMVVAKGDPRQAIGPMLGIIISVAIAVLYQEVAADNVERSRLIAELVATRDNLLAAQEELAETQRRAGALEERSRLARDIHDTLAQSFSAITLLARAGLRGEPEGSPTHETLDHIEQTSTVGLAEARRVVNALAPTDLDQTSLTEALQRQVDRLAHETDIDAQFEVVGTPTPLPTPFDVALLRFALGALANVRIHSRAHTVRVTLTYDTDQVSVDVVDDGIGIDRARSLPSAVGRSGFGLRSMRERLSGIGGHLEVESTPDHGTAVVAVIPLGHTSSAPGRATPNHSQPLSPTTVPSEEDHR